MKQHKPFCMMMTNLFVAAVLLLLMAGSVQAQEATADTSVNMDMPLTKEKLNRIEDNLVRDIESPSVGVCLGGAQVVRELKAKAPDYSFSKVIIPLMKVLKDKSADRAARMMAALALHDVNSDRGNFAIKREAEMSDDDLLKTVCMNLAQVHKAKEGKK